MMFDAKLEHFDELVDSGYVACERHVSVCPVLFECVTPEHVVFLLYACVFISSVLGARLCHSFGASLIAS